MTPASPCILCGGERLRCILTRGQWRYLECRNCGLVCLHPRPSLQTLRHSYMSYLPSDAAAIKQWETLVQPVVDVSAALLETATQRSGRLLDVGCGFGFFMERMRRAGWAVEGIELSPTGRRHARERWGLDIYAQPLEELSLQDNRYDAVTLFYVIEHVENPIAVLKTVKRILKPGGVVLLRWPHTTPIVKLLRPWAAKLDLYHTPYHLYDFSPRTMAMLLDLSGFTAIETIIGGHTCPAHRPSRWVTRACGRLAQTLLTVSKGCWLLPGVSKTTLGRG